MSDTDVEELQRAVCSDSESEPSVRSLMDSTQKLGVNVCATSAGPTQDRTSFKCLNLPSLKSAPYKGNRVGNVPSEEAGSCKGGNFLETPIHTTPWRNTPQTLSCHCGWAMGRGRGCEERERKSLHKYRFIYCKILITPAYYLFYFIFLLQMPNLNEFIDSIQQPSSLVGQIVPDNTTLRLKKCSYLGLAYFLISNRDLSQCFTIL